MSSEPVRESTSDLVAFDVRKQSPEQIARICARWKERKRLDSRESLRSTSPDLMTMPPVAGSRGGEHAPQVPKTPRGLGGPIHYSTSFEEVLAVREPSLAQRVWNPDAPPTLAPPHPPRRRSRIKWVLAGAASLFAVATVAGGALWEQSTAPTNRLQTDVKPARDGTLIASPAEPALAAGPSYPTDIPMAEPFVATAVAPAKADWPMQAVDLVLMTSAPLAETARLPLMPQLKPPAPVVQTASTSAPPQSEPGLSAIARMELPLAASLTTATVSAPAAQMADPRPDGPISLGNDKGNDAFGFPDQVASSNSGASGSAGSEPDPGSGSAGRDGSGDPSGDTGGVESESGGDPGDDGAGGTDRGGGNSSGGGAGRGESGGGESGIGIISGGKLDGNSGGPVAESGDGFGDGKSGDGATGGDAGGDDSGAGDAGRGDGNGSGVAGGDDSGDGESAKGGKSDEGAESEDSESGEEGSTGARIGRGLGGLGDALDGLGGPLGGEKGGAKGGGGNSNDNGK